MIQGLTEGTLFTANYKATCILVSHYGRHWLVLRFLDKCDCSNRVPLAEGQSCINNTPYPLKGSSANAAGNLIIMKNLNINFTSPTKEEYYYKVLLLLNVEAPPHLQSTPPNLELLSRFLALPKEMQYMPFNSRARRIISKSYPKPLSVASMSIKIARLISTKHVTRDEDGFLDFSPAIRKIRDSHSFTLNVSFDTQVN